MAKHNNDNKAKVHNGIGERKAHATILFVDQDEVMHKAVEKSLWPHYNVITARDAQEGLEMAIQYQPAVIILEIFLPIIDGFSALLMLKEMPLTKNIPIIMMSSLKRKERIIQAFRDGASGYLLKPFSKESLLIKINSLLSSPGSECAT